MAPGERLAHYRIERQLGEGGMGVVYAATDEKLERQVAIKVLPERAASRPDRRARFIQEARAASALNHPNIVTVHDVSEVDGATFIVMELVEGESLAQILERGKPPLAQALGMAVSIADALARAHSQGIVHRDIKPANVMVNGQGELKVLDFGLAKLSQTDDSEARTRERVEPITRDGDAVGTPSYMSPEQAQGKSVDARSDIFSFGAVLYELLTGRRAFAGNNQAAIMSAVLRDEPPPPSQLASNLPNELDRVVSRALQKEPQRRWQSMADLCVALREVSDEIETRRRRRPLPAKVVVAVGLVVVAVFLARELLEKPPAAMRLVPLTSFDGAEQYPALSPNGDRIAYTWVGENGGSSELYVQSLEGNPRQLTDGEGGVYAPAWSPDGTRIAFLRHLGEGDTIFEIDALGGQARLIGKVWQPAHGLSYMPDGRRLVLSDRVGPQLPSAIFSLSLDTGERAQLTTPPSDLLPTDGDLLAAVSPDGKRFAFVRRRGGYLVGDLFVSGFEDPEPVQVTFDDTSIRALAWADEREIVFASPRGGFWALWRVSAAGGEPTKLPLGDDPHSLTASGNGLLAYERYRQNSDIWRLGGPASDEPGFPTRLMGSSYLEWYPEYSPDGSKIAFDSARAGGINVWICDADGSNCNQFTRFGPDHEGGQHATQSKWSPDGRRLVFAVINGTGSRLYTADVESAIAVPGPDLPGGNPRWSRDGNSIYFPSNESGEPQVWKMDADGGNPRQITRGGGVTAYESWDGETLYYSKSEVGQIWSVPVEGGEERVVLEARTQFLEWDVWQNYLVYVRYEPERSIEQFDLETRETRVLARLGEGTRTALGLSVSPDGRWVLFTLNEHSAHDIMLIRNFH